MTETIPMYSKVDTRKMRKLRVTLLDRCNFRCSYCMPKHPVFTPSKDLLTADEIENICAALIPLGIEQLRLTGGEPTLRRDFPDILQRLAGLNVKKLCLTSNGFLLEQHLKLLWETGCHHINISLDSLSADKFLKITRFDGFKQVYQAILKAKDMGFHVKINTLVMRNINDKEILDFIDFSSETGIEVRFLELMKIGKGGEQHQQHFVPVDEILETIKQSNELTAFEVENDSTSFDFLTQSGAHIGFIASESRPFCSSCSRLRLSPKGILRACLMTEKGLNLRGVPVEDYPSVLKKVVEMKPLERLENIEQNMYQIGG